MATTVGHPAAAASYSSDVGAERAPSVPWQLYGVSVAATFVVVGIIWDISWHMTIGRDTFWSPPHVCTYAAGLIVGIVCGWTAIETTFRGTAEERARSVAFWGFRAPLGAWICVWGSFAMLTSGPFDDWWHNAYGLDVKIQSPPHTLLVMGMVAIVVGAVVWTLAWQNRVTDGALRRRLEWLYVYDAGMLLSMVAIFVTENSWRGIQHSSVFYRTSALAYPVVLVAVARGSTMRWPATMVALVYMAVRILMGWILPLFPAEPKLGPIWNPVTHMVAMEFPLLLVAPAITIDLLTHRFGRTAGALRDWGTAPLYAFAFVLSLLAVQWPFVSFLQSSSAWNWVFFTDRSFSYMGAPKPVDGAYPFATWTADPSPFAFAMGILRAVLYAFLSTRLGMAWGRWMTGVRR